MLSPQLNEKIIERKEDYETNSFYPHQRPQGTYRTNMRKESTFPQTTKGFHRNAMV
jgi:hypothetical protein